jgi:hypothetical protein
MHNAHSSEIATTNSSRCSTTFAREGKIRMYGVALGPAIGWLYEGVEAARRNVTQRADDLEHARAVPGRTR